MNDAVAGVPPPAEPDLQPPISDAAQVTTYELATLQTFEAVQAPRRHSSELVPFHRISPKRHPSPDTNPSISIISSFLPPTIPPEPHIPLSFLGEERLQVSNADTTDIDMRSCVFGLIYARVIGSLTHASRLWVLLRLPKFGIYLEREKLEAIISGDLSGTVLDPFWVAACNTLGASHCINMDSTPGMVRLHARRAQLAWESFADVVKGNDHKLKAQASITVATGYINMHLTQSAFLYFQKSCDFIKAGNLQFIPTYGCPPAFSEELHETLAVLSQAIYWMNYSFLVCGGPEPYATAKLENEFRRELPVGDYHPYRFVHNVDHLPQQAYPFLYKICPLTMRTRGILFVRDVILLLNAVPTNGKHHALGSTIGTR